MRDKPDTHLCSYQEREAAGKEELMKNKIAIIQYMEECVDIYSFMEHDSCFCHTYFLITLRMEKLFLV